MRRSAWTVGAAVLAALSLGVAACGGSDDGGNEGSTTPERPPRRKRSGAGSSRCCGAATSITSTAARPTTRWAYFICNATQKHALHYKPDDGAKMVPDLAEGDPQVSEDGKTVTVKIKPGVKFSPPYDKEVTSEDVKYAIERGFFTSVASGFIASYFADLVGAEVGVEGRHRDRGHHDARRPDARPEVQARGRRRRWPPARSALPARPRRCRRSTRPSSTRRRRRPTARTSSRPART